jgi:hypothetical protein
VVVVPESNQQRASTKRRREQDQDPDQRASMKRRSEQDPDLDVDLDPDASLYTERWVDAHGNHHNWNLYNQRILHQLNAIVPNVISRLIFQYAHVKSVQNFDLNFPDAWINA